MATSPPTRQRSATKQLGQARSTWLPRSRFRLKLPTDPREGAPTHSLARLAIAMLAFHIPTIDIWPDDRAVSLWHRRAHVQTLYPNID